MSHVIPLNMPDELYEKLTAYAEQKKQPIDKVVMQCLTEGVQRLDDFTQLEAEYDPTLDPLFQIAGMLTSGTPDLSENHDTYLAEAYADDHADEK